MKYLPQSQNKTRFVQPASFTWFLPTGYATSNYGQTCFLCFVRQTAITYLVYSLTLTSKQSRASMKKSKWMKKQGNKRERDKQTQEKRSNSPWMLQNFLLSLSCSLRLMVLICSMLQSLQARLTTTTTVLFLPCAFQTNMSKIALNMSSGCIWSNEIASNS